MKAKILSVTLKREVDDSPDTSYLGEYKNRPDGNWYADREAGTLCDGDDVLADSLHVNYSRDEYRYICGFQHDGNQAQWAHVDDKGVNNAYLNLRYTGNHGEVKHTRNLFKWFGVRGWETAQTRREKIRCIDMAYCCLAVLRLERLNQGDWCYLGITALADVRSESGIIQTIRSGGLWGIESDSGEDYFAEVEEEELDGLRRELGSFGFGKRAIDYAFKRVERKD